MQNTQQPQSGLAPNIASLLCYLAAPLVAIVFLVIEKNNRDVRFHAFQGLFLGIFNIALYIVMNILVRISYYFGYLWSLISLGLFILMIVMMIKAYKGEKFKLPVIGDLAEQKANA